MRPRRATSWSICKKALDRETRGASVLLGGRFLNGRATFTAPSLVALEASTLRPEDFGRVKVSGAASPFKGESHVTLTRLRRSGAVPRPLPFPLYMLASLMALGGAFREMGSGTRCACPAGWLSPLRGAADYSFCGRSAGQQWANATLLRAGTSWDSGADDCSGCSLSAALRLGRGCSYSRDTEVRSCG